jgi:hypothetical protein
LSSWESIVVSAFTKVVGPIYDTSTQWSTAGLIS